MISKTQFSAIFDNFTDQEKAERVAQSIFSFSLTPPNVPVLIPKQFLDFEKNPKKIKKTPFTPKIGKIHKKCLFKGIKRGQNDFFFFF